MSESGGEVPVTRRFPEPTCSAHSTSTTFSTVRIKRYLKLMLLGERDSPYPYAEHQMRARDALNGGLPFDVSKRNYNACKSWYDSLQECADGKVPFWSKKKCPKWEKLYMFSCVETPEQDTASAQK